MKKFWLVVLSVALAAALGVTVFSAPGDQSDPVVSLSYLESVLRPQLKQEIDAMAQQSMEETYRDSFCTLTESIADYNLKALQASTADKSANGTLLLKKGDELALPPGTQVLVHSGLVNVNTDALIDVSRGEPVAKDAVLEKEVLYMKGDSALGGLVISSDTAELYVNGIYRLTASAAVDYGSMAQALNIMGLFKGTGTSFDLESSATRVQGLVMFLRILGEEDAALSYTGAHPFTDIPKSHWAYKYVAYAYSKGYTTGTSASLFTPNSSMTAQQYLTFVLRALSYKEGAAFTYQTAVADAASLGLFSQAELTAITKGAFLRSQMVYLSYYSLYGIDQASHTMLLNKLIDAGAIDRTDAYDAICQVNGRRIA